MAPAGRFDKTPRPRSQFTPPTSSIFLLYTREGVSCAAATLRHFPAHVSIMYKLHHADVFFEKLFNRLFLHIPTWALPSVSGVILLIAIIAAVVTQSGRRRGGRRRPAAACADRQRGVTRCNPQLQFYRVHIQFHLPSYQYGDAPIKSLPPAETTNATSLHGFFTQYLAPTTLHEVRTDYFCALSSLSPAASIDTSSSSN
ncbi:hypothetical protein ACJJTC_016391 [Scirpophaga incertulas]